MINGMTATATQEIKDKVRKMMLVDASERTAVEAALAMWGPKETESPFDFPLWAYMPDSGAERWRPIFPTAKLWGSREPAIS